MREDLSKLIDEMLEKGVEAKKEELLKNDYYYLKEIVKHYFEVYYGYRCLKVGLFDFSDENQDLFRVAVYLEQHILYIFDLIDFKISNRKVIFNISLD